MSDDDIEPTLDAARHEVEAWWQGHGRNRAVGFRCSCGRRLNRAGPDEGYAMRVGRWHAAHPGSDLRAVTMAGQAVTVMRAVAAGRTPALTDDYADQLVWTGVLVEDVASRWRSYRVPERPLRLTDAAVGWLAERDDFDGRRR